MRSARIRAHLRPLFGHGEPLSSGSASAVYLHLVAQPERGGSAKEAATLQNRNDVSLKVGERVTVRVEVERVLEGVHGQHASNQARIPTVMPISIVLSENQGRDSPEQHAAKRGDSSEEVSLPVCLDVVPYFRNSSLGGDAWVEFGGRHVCARVVRRETEPAGRRSGGRLRQHGEGSGEVKKEVCNTKQGVICRRRISARSRHGQPEAASFKSRRTRTTRRRKADPGYGAPDWRGGAVDADLGLSGGRSPEAAWCRQYWAFAAELRARNARAGMRGHGAGGVHGTPHRAS